ncbi:cation transporter protein [Leptospira ryugenii]|uniref:Cation transporter protein n=1 Tax=Leptospira ryugenii TaxID=1917863 RepID=A0A2P2E1Y9_9LEPT|nr:SMR family transporter [Leptospira ryugenii]GBF50869.1 cation transporter protein [Leptospira ryugenii]
MQVQIVLFFCIAVFFNALANILMKTSSLADAEKPIQANANGLFQTLFNPYFILGLASFGLALLGYRFVLGKGLKLSLAYPVFTSSGFIIVLLASAFFFKERLNLTQWIGIVFILIGVWLTALQMFDVES